VARERLAKAMAAASSLALPTAAIISEAVGSEIEPAFTPAGRILVAHTGRVRGVAASLLGAAIPIQLLAERLARARGVDPDTLGREDAAQAAAHSG